jgi:hypothetical protein
MIRIAAFGLAPASPARAAVSEQWGKLKQIEPEGAKNDAKT